MPSDKEFDNILKNKFEGFEAPLPDGGWNKIKDRIPRKKRRPVLLPLMAAASIFFAILSGYLFLKQQDLEASLKASQPQDPSVTAAMQESPRANTSPTMVSPSSANATISSNEATQAPHDVNDANTNAESVISDGSDHIAMVPQAVPENGNPAASQGSTFSHQELLSTNDEIRNAIQPILVDPGVATSTVNATSGDLVNTLPSSLEQVQIEHDGMLNAVNNGISKAFFRRIVLMETSGRELSLFPAILVEEVLNNLSSLEDKKDEEDIISSKWHFGAATSMYLTSTFQQANIDDEKIVSEYHHLNTIDNDRFGIGADVLTAYDITDKLQVVGMVNYTRFSDKNNYTVLEENTTPSFVTNSDNSFSFSAYTLTDVLSNTTINYVGLKGGLKYFVGSVRSSYVMAKVGGHMLVRATENGYQGSEHQNTMLNYSSGVALGRSYRVNDHYSLNVEPEMTFFLHPYSKGGNTQSTPYMLGVNLILIR